MLQVYAYIRLQLNSTKTEVGQIWFGTAASLRKIKKIGLVLHVGVDVIKPVSVVRDLGVLFDQEAGTIHEAAHQQGDQCLCLPVTTIEASSSYAWSQNHRHSYWRLHFEPSGLL